MHGSVTRIKKKTYRMAVVLTVELVNGDTWSANLISVKGVLF